MEYLLTVTTIIFLLERCQSKYYIVLILTNVMFQSPGSIYCHTQTQEVKFEKDCLLGKPKRPWSVG